LRAAAEISAPTAEIFARAALSRTGRAARRRYTETLEKELLVDPSEGITIKARVRAPPAPHAATRP
jgi:hypothetical protein